MKQISKTLAILAFALALAGTAGCGALQHDPTRPAVPAPATDGSSPADSTRHAAPHRLASDPRQAIRLEAYFAIRTAHDGGWSQTYRGWPTSNWSYLLNDPNAYSVIKGWFGGNASLWTGWPSYFTNMDVYSRTNLSRGGVAQADVLSHAGQCRGFANLILYRSGTFQSRLPAYGSNPAGYRSFSQIRVGDVIETTWANGHTAVVVEILAGVEGRSVTSVRVVDSNFIGDEVIGMHTISVTNSGTVSDLRSYRALNLSIS